MRARRWTGRLCGPWPTPQRSASQHSHCTSARPPTKPTGSAATGRPGGGHLPLEVIVSPHCALVAPLVNYFWSLHRLRPDLTLTIIVPEIVTRHWWHHILHDHVAGRLRRALRDLPAVMVTSAPFHLTH